VPAAKTSAPAPAPSRRALAARARRIHAALLAAYGVPLPQEGLAQDVEAAVALATRIGFPVVLKAVCATLTHKSDVGAVQLNLRDADALRAAWARIEANLAAHGFADALEGMLVAQMVSGGLELVMGVHRDPEMGPAVMVGMGGVWLELFKDVAFAPPGLGLERARETIAQTRAAQLLAGYRGAPPCDVEALAQAMVNLGRLACELGDVIEAVDVNPVAVRAQGRGVVALDALVVLRPPQ
jgi:acyl-CoA synthetase (NDP forming)